MIFQAEGLGQFRSACRTPAGCRIRCPVTRGVAPGYAVPALRAENQDPVLLRFQALQRLLRVVVALRRGAAVLLQRAGEVLRDAVAALVQHAEVVLRVGVALRGGLLVPLAGLREVLRYALAVVVQRPEVELRPGVPAGRRLHPP